VLPTFGGLAFPHLDALARLPACRLGSGHHRSRASRSRTRFNAAEVTRHSQTPVPNAENLPGYDPTTRLTDGDTLTVLDSDNVQHKIRLHGIDAPEKGQAFGTKSQAALATKVFSQTVRVEVIDVDRYRREVGRIYLGDRFINLEMVRDGFAWRYPQYDKPGEFSAAESAAREHGRGLWADPHPVPHWEFRRAKRQGRPLE